MRDISESKTTNQQEEGQIDWKAIRSRMISETEEFIDHAMKHPESAVVIPTVPVGSGTFPRTMSWYFWQRVLGSL